MKSRIIKIRACKTCSEVLIFLNRNDDGDFVEIIAWHNTKEGNMIQRGIIGISEIDNEKMMCEHIISDFSDYAANSFANSFKL